MFLYWIIILLPILLVAALAGIWQLANAKATAADVFDRSLLSAALAVARDVAVSDGDALSERTRDLLSDTSGGTVFYHVYAPDGVIVAGYSTPPVGIQADEIEDAVRRNRRLAADLDAETMCLRLIKYRASRIGVQVVGEGVGVGTVVIVHESSLGTSFSRCLYVGNPAVFGCLVGLPLAGAAAAARRELRQYEADIAGRQSDEALVEVVRQSQGDRRRAATRRYSDAGDRNIDPIGGIDRNAVARRRSRLSRRSLRSGRAICARGAIVAFTASKEKAEEDERCNSARADHETCHFGHPSVFVEGSCTCHRSFSTRRYYR